MSQWITLIFGLRGFQLCRLLALWLFDSEETSDAMAGELLTLTIDLHDGDAEAQAWGLRSIL